MSFKTTLNKASTLSDSLRTTVPAAIINQFNLKEGDILDWELKIKKNSFIVTIKPIKK